MASPVAIPKDALPRVAYMGINRRPEQMAFRRHVVGMFVFNHLVGASARCRLDGQEFVLGADMVHVARRGDVMSGAGTDGPAGVWRWVAFTWPGDQDEFSLPRLIRLAGRGRAAYAEAFDELFAQYAGGVAGWELRGASLLIQLADTLRAAAERPDARVGPSAQRARLAADYLLRHARTRLRLREVADAVGLNVAYLTRIFRTQYGTTPMQYLMRARLREARRLLIEEPDMPVRQVCAQAGFCDFGHFARAFRRGYEQSPSELRLRSMAATRHR